MAVRQTSASVYHKINAQGLLSKMRLSVYNALYQHGPATAQEIFRHLRCDTNQSGRFTELRDLGVIREVRVRPCSVTGHEVIEWDVTANLPNGKVNKKSPTGELRALVEIGYRILSRVTPGKSPLIDDFVRRAEKIGMED